MLRHTPSHIRSFRWIVLGVLAIATAQAQAQDTFRGVAVAPERRCAPYDRSDYRYPQSVERRIVDRIGKIYSPYTGQCFASTGETDIEHIIALSEAHDSGLLRRQRRGQIPIRPRSAEPHAGQPSRQPQSEGRWRRRRMATATQRVLVCGQDARSAPAVRPDHRRTRGVSGRRDPRAMRFHGHARVRLRRCEQRTA